MENTIYLKYGNPYFRIVPSDKVEKGKAVVSEELNYLCSNGRARNRDIQITVQNIYYKDELNVKVASTYTKNTFTKQTGYKNYDEYAGAVFVNIEEYINLFNKAPYQSSVFVKDAEKLQETINKLNEIGIKAQHIKDFKINDNIQVLQFVKIFKLIVTCILIFGLFFISYFIIRIILKSRNIYFTTLRILGSTTKNVKTILDIELFINSSLAYLSLLVLITLVKYNIINITFVNNLIDFLSVREYVVMYVILIVMSQLISRRFAKKIFKKSAIKTYNEEV